MTCNVNHYTLCIKNNKVTGKMLVINGYWFKYSRPKILNIYYNSNFVVLFKIKAFNVSTFWSNCKKWTPNFSCVGELCFTLRNTENVIYIRGIINEVITRPSASLKKFFFEICDMMYYCNCIKSAAKASNVVQ